VSEPGVLEQSGRAVDRPALDEAGRIQVPVGARVEVATRLQPEVLASPENLANDG
jgi:hypothetical protein